MQWEDVEVPAPGQGEARIRHTAIGLNYVDTYQRSGLYPQQLPEMIVGGEGAGIVEEIGANVTDIKIGDRVAYGNAPPGAYCEARVLPASRLGSVKIPAGISDQQAASMMLKGLTTQYLLRTAILPRRKPGETVLFHAAAGGVGLIFGQWAKHLGAHRDRWHGRLRRQGAPGQGARPYDHVILYRETELRRRG